MLDQVMFGDHEIRIECFPQSSEPIAHGSDDDWAAKISDLFQTTFRPILLQPLIRSLGAEGSAVLLLPVGKSRSREGEAAYDVWAVNAQKDQIIRRRIDHVPVHRRKEQRQTSSKTNASAKERLKFLCTGFLDNRLGQFLDAADFDRQVMHDVSLVFQPTRLDDIIPQALPGRDVISAQFQEAFSRWIDLAFHADVYDTMARLPGRQTVSVFSYLNARSSGKKKRRAKKAMQDGVDLKTLHSANRCHALREYPLLASELDAFRKSPHSERVDTGTSTVQEAVSQFWSIDKKPNADLLMQALLRKDETDLPASLASRLSRVAHYGCALDSLAQSLPQTKTQWQGFEDIIAHDQALERVFLRKRYQTVRDVGAVIANDGNRNAWQGYADRLSFIHPDTGQSVTQTIAAMMGRVGLTRLAPIALNMRDEEALIPDVGDNQIITLCGLSHESQLEGVSNSLQKTLEEDGLSLIGQFFEDTDLDTLLAKQTAFMTGQQRQWHREITRLAVSERFSMSAGQQSVMGLPGLPDRLQRELPHYQIVPVDNAGQAIQVLRNMRSNHAWDILEDMIYKKVHFVFCVRSYNGQTVGMFVLEEVQGPNQPLRLHMVDRYYGRDDETFNPSNELAEKMAMYVHYLNGLEMTAKPYHEARERMRRQAERLVGERASLGFSRKNLEETVQLARRFQDSYPDALRIDAQGGLRYSCPALSGDESVYAFIRRKLHFLDPHYRKLQAKQASSFRVVR